MANLFLIRHGVTSANKTHLFQGITDNDLSEEGHCQAENIASYFQPIELNNIYSSPLNRAIQTATPLSKLKNLDIQIIPEFHEVDCGIWEGMNVESVKNNYPEELKKWLLTGNARTPEGESLSDVHIRIKEKILEISLDTLKKEHNNVIFSHGAMNRVAICTILKLPVEKSFCFEQKNGCINVFSLRDQFPPSLSLLNYTDHIQE